MTNFKPPIPGVIHVTGEPLKDGFDLWCRKTKKVTNDVKD